MRILLRGLIARSFKKKSKPEMITPNDLTCQEIVELVTDYLEDALLPATQERFEDHVAQCVGCINYVDQVRKTISMLRKLAEEPAFPDTKEELLDVFRGWKDQ